MTDGGGAVPLKFEILGEVRVLRGGEPVDLGPAKQRAVLAVLLLQAGKPVPTHQIVDAVWGDEPPENGANVVQKYVAGLRRVLDPDRAPRTPGELLALTGGGYVLRTADGTVDADDFHAATARAAAERAAGRLAEATDTLRAALALWRGPALSGLTGPVFEAARTRLAEAHATAWEKWADVELARGRDTTLIPDLSRLVQQFPLREGLRAQLMIALHQGGRQAEALAAFRDAREYFLEEFGVEPGERMQETHRKILRGEGFYAEPVDPWAASDPAGAASSPPTSPAAYPPPVIPVQPYSPPLGPYLPSGPFIPQQLFAPPARKRSVVEMIFAGVTPILLCSIGNWVYFAYAGFRRHDKRQFIVAGVYAAVFIIGVIVGFFVDPSPLDSDESTNAEAVGFALILLPPFVAALHGMILASQPSDRAHDAMLREQARQFAALDPARARLAGVGRPGMQRAFSDGDLVDLNHATGPELSWLPGITPEIADRILRSRYEHGPFHRPGDLIIRGLVPAKTANRLGPRLICVPTDLFAPPALPYQAPPASYPGTADGMAG